MRIFCTHNRVEENTVELKLDSDNYLMPVETVEYSVHLSVKEQEKLSQDILNEYIERALEMGIDIYTAQNTLDRLTKHVDLIIGSADTTFMFSTSDKEKEYELERLVIDFASKVRDS